MCFAVRHTNSLVTARDTKMTTYVYAFGCNVDGQLGIKHNEGNQLKPIKVESLNGKNIIKINCSQTHSAAIGSNGFLYTCGNNDNNEHFFSGFGSKASTSAGLKIGGLNPPSKPTGRASGTKKSLVMPGKSKASVIMPPRPSVTKMSNDDDIADGWDDF